MLQASVNHRFHLYIESSAGAAFYTPRFKLNDTEYKLEIWEVAGSQRYDALLPMYCRNASIALIANEHALTNCVADWRLEPKG